ncbi:MAG: hypothetical protein LBV12_08485 [Puniceicoccales bacterium]|nr:hypothetical protein [Puniceicoccales bacterium]
MRIGKEERFFTEALAFWRGFAKVVFMKPGVLFSLFLLLAMGVAGCSSPDSRIKDNQAVFDTYSLETQYTIRQGKVQVGFDELQVRMAMGDPDRVYTRTTTVGKSQVWAYTDNSPSIGFGIGVGGGTGSSTRVGTGLGVNTYGDRSEDRARIVFEEGKVSAVEELEN